MKPLARNLIRLLCIGAGAALASGAYAQGYVGVGVGQGNASLPSVNTTFMGYTFTGASDKSSDTAYKIYGGYQFTPNWGVEVGYNDLGNKYSFTGALAGTPYNGTYKMDNVYVAATGTLPLQGGFSLLGKLGVSANKASGGVCVGSICESLGSDNKTDVMVGIGAQYKFMNNWAARLEYENYGKVTGDDVYGTGSSGALKADAWNVSVNYAF
jgi:OOP family OmpA-OmpF porin